MAIEAASAGRNGPDVERGFLAPVQIGCDDGERDSQRGEIRGHCCPAEKFAQNFSASSCVAWLHPPENQSVRLPARAANSRRTVSLRLCAKAMTWWRMSRPRMPAA